MARLPLVLAMNPDFNSLYVGILKPSAHLPHFSNILSTIALAFEPLSIGQIAEIVGAQTFEVTNVLVNLHAIMQVPGDDHTPLTLWHTSLRDFLCSKIRAGPFFATHRPLVFGCIALSTKTGTTPPTPALKYSQHFLVEHWTELMDDDIELDGVINHLQLVFPSKIATNVHLHVLNKILRCGAEDTRLSAQVKMEGSGWLALERVILIENQKGLRLLVDVGVELKHPPQDGAAVLEIAIHAGNQDHLHILHKTNAEVLNQPFRDGCTMLEVVCRANDWKLVQALVNAGANVNTQFQGEGNGIRVALHAACHYKAKKTVYFLLEKGADPNVVATKSIWLSGWGGYAFPLAWAAAKGDVNLVNRLLACGADPNLKGGWYGSALHACAWEDKDEVARFLLEHGADVNIKSDKDSTPLHWASQWEYIEVAKCLLEFNADPNLQNDGGDTPLHSACYQWRREIAECLLDHNADPSIRNKTGRTALQHAQFYGKQKVVEMFQQRGITE